MKPFSVSNTAQAKSIKKNRNVGAFVPFMNLKKHFIPLFYATSIQKQRFNSNDFVCFSFDGIWESLRKNSVYKIGIILKHFPYFIVKWENNYCKK